MIELIKKEFHGSYRMFERFMKVIPQESTHAISTLRVESKGSREHQLELL